MLHGASLRRRNNRNAPERETYIAHDLRAREGAAIAQNPARARLRWCGCGRGCTCVSACHCAPRGSRTAAAPATAANLLLAAG